MALAHGNQPQNGLSEFLTTLMAESKQLGSLQQAAKVELMLGLQTLLAAIPVSARKPALTTLVKLGKDKGKDFLLCFFPALQFSQLHALHVLAVAENLT